jgi:hypothetical protein
VNSFAQITSNVTVQQELKKAYGSVNNIDPFEGGLAEDHAPGSDMGPLFTAILTDQFTRLRSGDRYFYLNEQWTPDELNLLLKGDSLAKVIEANTGVTNLQSDVFKFTASISGTVYFDYDGDGAPRTSGEFGVPGLTVQLQDTSGDVLATTVTDIQGHYRFTQLSGPSGNVEIASGASATGDYNVVLVLPGAFQQTTPNPATILLSRGGLNVTGVDFGVDLTRHAPAAGGTAAPTVAATSPGVTSTQAVSGAAGVLAPTSTGTAPVTSPTPQASASEGQASGVATVQVSQALAEPDATVSLAGEPAADTSSDPLSGVDWKA